MWEIISDLGRYATAAVILYLIISAGVADGIRKYYKDLERTKKMYQKLDDYHRKKEAEEQEEK